jgi:glutathione S-transferase
MCRFARLPFEVREPDSHDPGARRELLLPSSSSSVPSLEVDDIQIRDTLAMGEYLWETGHNSTLLPSAPAERARCRSICGEIDAGTSHLRSALPMNIKAHHKGFKVFSGAQADIDRIVAIWQDCLASSGGPYLLGPTPTMADAMYAPVCTRFVTYDVDLPEDCAKYVQTIMALPEMAEWITAAQRERDDFDEVDVDIEF